MFSYDWNWSVVWQYREALLGGLLVTMSLSAVAIVLGTGLGLVLGAVLALTGERVPFLRSLLLIAVDSIKAMPPLIVLLLFYYWMPYVVGVRSPFWLAAMALTLSLSAFVADVFRHALQGVPRPLVEASYALGMTRSIVLRHVLFPEALRVIVPTLGLLALDIFKLSSLASVVAVRELTYRASEISTNSFRFLEVYAALALIYLVILFPFSRLVRRLETSELFIRRS
jgi:polar amino acid transport system permease protein